MRPSDDQIQATVERAEAAAIIVDTSTDPAPHRTPDAGPRRISAEGRRARRDSNARTTPNRRGAETLTERIIDGNELSNLNYLMLGLFAARSVGRIVVRRDGRKMGTATGFLAAPGVLITNQHVLPDDATARDSQVQFQFEVDALGDELAPVTFALRTDPAPYIDKTLDIAVVAVAPKADDGTDIQAFGWLHLDRTPGKSPEGEFLTIIQHPRGERKQICVRENKLLKYEQDGRHVLYTSDTVAGSSGSPVFNNSWDVVALHHSGVPKTRMVRGKLRWVTVDGTTVAPSEDGTIDEELDLQWLCNEGVRISAIAAALAKLSSGNELARRVLAAPIPPTPPAGPWPTPLARSRPSSSDFDEVEAVGRGRREAAADQPSLEPGLRASTIVVPIEFVVGLRAAATVATSEVPAMEVNVLERSKPRDFDDRIGYQPDFLGPDFEVPLPKLSARQQHDVTASFEGSHELKYGTFSVVMCRSRSLAYFSAANLDRSTRGTSERGSWRNDPRIAPRE
ncbi:MAG TPA: trypsin-like peptidase domain-containing protein, partial [Acidimicrobiales bacterium]|nr:trypsin-like peptidase domain-containing protein [Acidimicrobiales bacterium]